VDTKGAWVIASPAIKDGVVYVGTSDSGLFHALDAKTGAIRFSLSTNHWAMFSSPAIAGSIAYVGTDEGKVLAVDLATGRLAWTFQTEGSKKNGAALTSPDGQPNYGAAMPTMFYDDIVSGVQKMFTVGAIISSPTVAGNLVLVGSADGSLYALY
jgi:outer membrane protein assembly factor BamB